MKTVGSILRQVREDKDIKLDYVCRELKINKVFLQCIEEGDYSRFSDSLYPQLYIKKYASFLGLVPGKMTAIFRRDYKEPPPKKEKLLQKLVSVSWQNKIVILVVILVFLGYLIYQYISFVSPPMIKVERIERKDNTIIIWGKTDSRASLKIEDSFVKLDKNGRFQYVIDNEDKEIVFIKAISPSGKTREISYPLKENQD